MLALKSSSTPLALIPNLPRSFFARYIELARQLQKVYKMEPAGSQGVWSLDDYQFVPFIWGSSQLVMNPKIAPEMFTSQTVVEDNADEFLFLSCIKFILQVSMNSNSNIVIRFTFL